MDSKQQCLLSNRQLIQAASSVLLDQMGANIISRDGPTTPDHITFHPDMRINLTSAVSCRRTRIHVWRRSNGPYWTLRQATLHRTVAQGFASVCATVIQNPLYDAMHRQPKARANQSVSPRTGLDTSFSRPTGNMSFAFTQRHCCLALGGQLGNEYRQPWVRRLSRPSALESRAIARDGRT